MTTATEVLIRQVYDRINLDDIPEYRRQLVHVAYDDSFNDSDIDAILRDGYSEHTDEWISDRQWEAACDLADELFKDECADAELHDDLVGDWLASSEREDLIHTLQELDTSRPYDDLLRNTSPVLFRVQQDEDDMVFLDADTLNAGSFAVMNALGLGPSWHYAIREILPEIAGYAAGGGDHFGVAIVFRANPGVLWNVPDDAHVTVSDPFIWLTNPWAGNGYGVVAKAMTVTLKRSEIHTDKAAWGYGADDVFGGLYIDESDITVDTSTVPGNEP